MEKSKPAWREEFCLGHFEDSPLPGGKKERKNGKRREKRVTIHRDFDADADTDADADGRQQSTKTVMILSFFFSFFFFFFLVIRLFMSRVTWL